MLNRTTLVRGDSGVDDNGDGDRDSNDASDDDGDDDDNDTCGSDDSKIFILWLISLNSTDRRDIWEKRQYNTDGRAHTPSKTFHTIKALLMSVRHAKIVGSTALRRGS